MDDNREFIIPLGSRLCTQSCFCDICLAEGHNKITPYISCTCLINLYIYTDRARIPDVNYPLPADYVYNRQPLSPDSSSSHWSVYGVTLHKFTR